MGIDIVLRGGHAKIIISYELNKNQIERIKNIIKKYLGEEINSANDDIDNDGFWKLALDIEQEIYDNFCICEDFELVDDIYMELKYNISFKVLDKYLRS